MIKGGDLLKKILSIFILTSALLLSGCASENVETEEPKVAEETVSSQEEAEAQEVVAPKSEIEEYDEQLSQFPATFSAYSTNHRRQSPLRRNVFRKNSAPAFTR